MARTGPGPALALPTRLVGLAALAGHVACSDCDLSVPDLSGDACTPDAEKAFVLQAMLDHHLFPGRLSFVNAADYEGPSDYLRALIEPIEEDRFSFIATRSGEVRFFEEGKALGYGFSLAFAGDELVLIDVLGDPGSEDPSSAAASGLVRGARILAIEGESVQQLREEDRLNPAFGPFEPDVSRTFRIRSRDGEERDVTLTTGFFSIVAVPVVAVYDRASGPVGYVVLRNFTEPADPALVDAFRQFREAGVHRLVVDLRYNGGGLIETANLLADLMVGRQYEFQTFVENRFNERNEACTYERGFEARDGSLERLDEVVFLTLEGTASASELVINGLRPWVGVRQVGRATFGKPVGQLGFQFCEKVLRPITFSIRNAVGAGDYYEGLQPTCSRPDDVDREFGDVEEGLLAQALALLDGGDCSESKARRGLGAAEPQALVRPGVPFERRNIF